MTWGPSSSRSLLPLLVVVAVLAVACTHKMNKPSNTGGKPGGGGPQGPTLTVKIDFLGPLSGTQAEFVIPAFQGAQLAVDLANAGAFGQLPVRIQLVSADSQGKEATARSLVGQVSADKDVVGVIGPASNFEVALAGDRLDQAGIPFITQAATDDALATHGWTHWFRAIANDSDQAGGAAQYIQSVLKPDCTFVASDGSAYGHGLAAIVFNNLKDAGARVDGGPDEKPPSGNYPQLVERARASGCQAFFYGGDSPEVGLLRREATRLDQRFVVLAGQATMNTSFLQATGAAGEGTLSFCSCTDLLGSSDPMAQKFIEDYRMKFGTDPGIYAAEAYDIAQIYIAAFKAGKTTRQDVTTFIRGIQDFHGVADDYRWQPSGELVPTDRSVSVFGDTNKSWIFLGSVLQPGSTSTTPPATPETVQQFLVPFATGFRSRLGLFLLDQLHPAVIDLYGMNQCQSFTNTLSDPTRAYRVISVSPLANWEYKPDGQSISVPNVYTVRVHQSAYGKTSDADIHLGLVENEIRWFTDCGTPR